jgi:transposase
MHDDIPPFSLFKDIVPFIILLCNIRKVYLCKKISRHAASWLFVVSNVRDETGFLLLYKRLENGHYRWPDKPEDLLEISSQQLRWLTEGLSISQPGAVQKVHPVHSF